MTAHLIGELIAAGGRLRKPQPRCGAGGVAYRRRAELAERHGRVPQGKRLVISSPSWEEMAKLGGGPDAVAKKIATALSASRPRPRYTVTPSAKLAIGQRRLLSDRMWDRAMATQFSRPES